ncbi:TetR/AcrR family transcriptional regulator [Orenia marismortui]|uniref:TetR/AcrR family transcriptional regulator n=1 Tax=Orenia marismortui TaxID=46469 RepID=UPI000380B1C7|nr:TetR/AcrR family transcriptional regulator [Orenia marismortui]
MSPKLVNVEQKRKEIIEGTLMALSKKELSELKIADIAKEINMGQSTIYEYFKNKDELIKQALEYFLQELYIPEENEELTVLEEFELILEKFKRQIEEERTNEINILIDVFYQGIKGDFEKLGEVYSDYIDYMVERINRDQKRGIIREDINPQALISWVGATFDGLWIQSLLRPKDFDVDKIFNSFLKAIEIYIKKD